ncbi:hypothetical protein ETAE_3038 [Edwardsiella piscicida]|uniref:Uncharacterized protein n=1 Tax=Edwardsiella piscicida TaxID=1263550 RepID=A0AAU8P739_EDWPI|nr:hypothetical protein ETAE_3038 [Edwardsiella tarda EIB202]
MKIYNTINNQSQKNYLPHRKIFYRHHHTIIYSTMFAKFSVW